MPALILIFGRDDLLLRSRCWLLESKGFEMRTSREIGQAGQILAMEPIELLILCHTLTAEECASILATAEGIRPQMKTLALDSTFSSLSGSLPGDGGSAVLDGFAEPKALIAAVRQIICASL